MQRSGSCGGVGTVLQCAAVTTLLIVDDEPNVRSALARALELEGFETRVADGYEAALALLDGVDLLLTDMQMPDKSGLELLLEARRRRPDLPVAIMTAYASVDGALEAMQRGAYDYLLKPCHTDEIILKVNLGLRLSRYEHELKARNEALEALTRELAEKNVQLERLATTDALTGLFNRRRFLERVDETAAATMRYHHPAALVMIDIDHFKAVNDTYGHPRGDAVLVEVAERLASRARAVDVVGRLGGEEFAVLLPNTSLEGARELAEGLRVAIESAPFEEVGAVTISVGVAPLAGDVPRALVEADRALYEAKNSGRNQVVAHAASTS